MFLFMKEVITDLHTWLLSWSLLMSLPWKLMLAFGRILFLTFDSYRHQLRSLTYTKLMKRSFPDFAIFSWKCNWYNACQTTSTPPLLHKDKAKSYRAVQWFLWKDRSPQTTQWLLQWQSRHHFPGHQWQFPVQHGNCESAGLQKRYSHEINIKKGIKQRWHSQVYWGHMLFRTIWKVSLTDYNSRSDLKTLAQKQGVFVLKTRRIACRRANCKLPVFDTYLSHLLIT